MSAISTLNEEDRIVCNPAVCHGKPVIRGTRVMVWLILEYLANGDSIDDVLAACPAITREDVFACLAYASNAAKERVVPRVRGANMEGEGAGQMAKKRVYIETSVMSYLTARPASDDLKRIHQQLTAVWWERRTDWDCFLTTLVMDEISRGDPEAAAKRRERAALLPELPRSTEARILADLLVARKLIPKLAAADAYHLALAAVYQAQYLLTWNQKHLDNFDLRSRIEELIRGWGLTPAKVITPERLLQEEPW